MCWTPSAARVRAGGRGRRWGGALGLRALNAVFEDPVDGSLHLHLQGEAWSVGGSSAQEGGELATGPLAWEAASS